MGRFASLVDSPSKIELFKEKYHIPQEIDLRYCSTEQIVTNREGGEVIIPIDDTRKNYNSTLVHDGSS